MKYRGIHQWLVRTFGKADKCENPMCPQKSKTYDYSLIHGKVYEKNRENFQKLCRPCHMRYDFSSGSRKGHGWTESMHEAAKKRTGKPLFARRGILHTEETKKKISEAKKGQVPWMKGKKWNDEDRLRISNSLKRYYATHRHPRAKA